MPIIILSDVQLPLGAASGKLLTSDGSGNATWQELTNAGVSATAAIAKSKLAPLAIVDSDVAVGAAIAKSKLAPLVIVDADISAGAAIAKAKLAALNIVNTDVNASAAIAESKLALASDAAAGTASRRTLGTGALQAASGTDARFTDTRVPTDLSVTNAKVSATAAIARSKLDFGSGLVNADIAAAAGIAKTKLAALDIVNADVNASAAIAKSKLAALSIVDADVSSGAAIAESKLALASDAAAGTASRRTLGTGATQAAAGNDARFTAPVIRAIARRNASMTVANNALTFVTFDTEVEDNDAMFATPPSAFITVKTAGLFMATAQFGWPVGAMTRAVMGIFFTPSGLAGFTIAADERIAGTSEGVTQNVSVVWPAAVNDAFQIILYQTNAGTLTKTITPAVYFPRLSVVRLGP